MNIGTETEKRFTVIRLALTRLSVADATGHETDAMKALDYLRQHVEALSEAVADAEAKNPE